MLHRAQALLLATTLALAPLAAHAENKMGYQLMSTEQAASLPSNQGSLGMQVVSAQQITSADLTFEILGVQAVRPGSPAATAGFSPGDEIIAVNGQVFPDPQTFAKFIGSMAPGTAVSFDYIPSGGGPAQAQRLAVTLGGPGQAGAPTQAGAPAQTPAQPGNPPGGLSTGTKIAIGVGAAALFGCYELGCFKKRGVVQPTAQQKQQILERQQQERAQQQRQQQLQQQQPQQQR